MGSYGYSGMDADFGAARRQVLGSVVDAGAALVAEAFDIDERLRRSGRRVGRASVYRTLEQLTELELIHKLDLGAETARLDDLEHCWMAQAPEAVAVVLQRFWTSLP